MSRIDFDMSGRMQDVLYCSRSRWFAGWTFSWTPWSARCRFVL